MVVDETDKDLGQFKTFEEAYQHMLDYLDMSEDQYLNDYMDMSEDQYLNDYMAQELVYVCKKE